jgi:hypothetical protein
VLQLNGKASASLHGRRLEVRLKLTVPSRRKDVDRKSGTDEIEGFWGLGDERDRSGPILCSDVQTGLTKLNCVRWWPAIRCKAQQLQACVHICDVRFEVSIKTVK